MRGTFEDDWGITLDGEAGLRIRAMFDEAVAGTYRGMYIQGSKILWKNPVSCLLLIIHLDQSYCYSCQGRLFIYCVIAFIVKSFWSA